MAAAILLACSIGLGPPGPEVYKCDIIELNHYRLALKQRVYYDQLIFWVWHAGEFEVIHWCGTAKYTGVEKINDGWYKINLGDKVILSPEFRERWTNYDPETNDRAKVNNRFKWEPEPDRSKFIERKTDVGIEEVPDLQQAGSVGPVHQE